MTDPRWEDARLASVARAVASVIADQFCVQLRDRTTRSDDALRPLADTLRAITSAAGSLFVVNRRVELARSVGADGVHAPAAELTKAHDFRWNSAPAHDAKQLHDACIVNANAVLVSPIFASPGKAPPRGLDALRLARPVAKDATLVALGGVDASNAASCREAGADAVAVIRALLDAKDAIATARVLAGAR